MRALIDIENSKTQKVISYEVDIIKHIDEDFVFDISSLNEDEMKILIDAINTSPVYRYTDIEMIYLENDRCPYFGPDYDYHIEDNKLYAKYNRTDFKKKKDL